MTLRPASIPLADTAEDDPRIGRLLGTALAEDEPAAVVIIGFPVDEGVVRNAGRVGASEGPSALRERLFRLCPDPLTHDAFCSLLARTRDLGDVVPSGELERDQEVLGEAVGRALAQGSRVLVLGGGHETSYGHFLGYANADLDVDIENFDAHADVRPLKHGRGHSGSPFRQALEHASGRCRGYRVHGLQRASVAAAHVRWLAEQGGACTWAEELNAQRVSDTFRNRERALLTTFCLDAVDQAFAPGVSAPSTGGLTPALWLHAAYEAGRCPTALGFDIVELNPHFDRDAQTARLAAMTAWHILRGLSETSH